MLALDCFDYPRHFDENNLKHPQDYTIQPTPIQPQYIVHERAGRRRLIFRASWKIDSESYMPMSFIVDTGSVKPLYFSQEALLALDQFGRLIECDLHSYVKFHYGDSNFDFTYAPAPCNIIGLTALQQLGLSVSRNGFSFQKAVRWI